MARIGLRDRPYQRRRKGPVVAVVAVLAVTAAATWTVVLVGAGPAGSGNCPATAAGAPVGESLAGDALDAVAPLPAGGVRVRVFNAGRQRGQANLVAAQLSELGFAQVAPPDNDPLFPDGDMECAGQVRFGPAGEAAASTVALVLPCAELVRDTRTDDTVDVSVGTAFGDLNPVKAARDALEQLAAPPTEETTANTDTGSVIPPPAPTADPAALKAAREAGC